MSCRVLFEPEARFDLEAAAEWYESEKAGLGARFLEELDRVVERLGDNAFQFPGIEAGIRRALLNRFPYGVYFTVDSRQVRIVAVLHMHRRPEAWRRRSRPDVEGGT